MSAELFEAIDQHDVHRIETLLAEGADPNVAHEYPPRWRPLGAAIEELEFGGSVEVIRLLLNYGADVNANYLDSKLVPLHAAMFSENMEVIQLLLESGADPNVLSEEDRLPLRFAVEQDSLEIATIFLRFGADKTINDSGGFSGYSALGLAARKLNVPMMELLLDAGADPEARDTDGAVARDHLPAREESNKHTWDRAMALLLQRL